MKPGAVIPALETTASSPPKAATASATRRAGVSGSIRSPTGVATSAPSPRNFSASFWSSSVSRTSAAAIAARSPRASASRANFKQVSPPIPGLDPVTNARIAAALQPLVLRGADYMPRFARRSIEFPRSAPSIHTNRRKS